jgi:hypothetical protein
MELDQVLSPHASRERTAAPYPLVLEGTLDTRDGERFLRISTAALLGPVEGADALSDGTTAAVVVSQEGVPYVVWPVTAGGGGDADKTYVHVQSAPSSVWVMTHNLVKYPAIDVVDSGDSVVIPSVHYDGLNVATLTFGSPTSGKAFAN